MGHPTEQIALTYLIDRGLALISRNFYTRFGEIDLIMKHQLELIFVEVRYRRETHYGLAETVNSFKQRKLIKAAQIFLQKYPENAWDSCRFDVIAISSSLNDPKIEWIPDAFSEEVG